LLWGNNQVQNSTFFLSLQAFVIFFFQHFFIILTGEILTEQSSRWEMIVSYTIPF